MTVSWASECMQNVATELRDDVEELSANCGYEDQSRLVRVANQLAAGACGGELLREVEVLIDHAHKKMASSSGRVLTTWRRFYTDACILRSLSDMELFTKAAIARLDRAIIIAGAAGHHKLELIHVLIRKAQVEFLGASCECYGIRPTSITLSPSTSKVSASSGTIPYLNSPPSLGAFRSQHSHQPFILRGFAHSWPALQEHSWSSLEYLRFVAGPGRVVPVEVGRDYRDNDWSQRLMDWEEFLAHTGLGGTIVQSDDETPTLYLAQHNLLMQFPALRDDICVPDYVYTSPSPILFPSYQPPGNDEQLIINAWLGPTGTLSPAHFDPYFNFYSQVVGYKTVWLAPPSSSNSMYPVAQLGSPHDSGGSTGNTSAVDVFGESDGSFPAFWADVVPHAMSATLEPGDVLFFPPGWWHAMRSETPSFSVSMWF
ncbi:hypothetical protein PLEOSDRAFT_152454 [Pleurotus ostreatus PC15]|uniref:JmjC domain-containing protein n=1 Tax=Pleurotus ostreatus (strain PC15) TaxID=1137138 RepID=A0A067P194_PLEO1|nr:hypothetical protein PLEOSDRAFT_152454 [Pleurotus ostreatus PC15]